uniref:Predicted O-antigen polymerase n=2 Tax=Escherichia albertii TaxID=208962 RepID=A0A5A4U7N7_ESCAL|nr:predicted O-antigen polymerase [Escherichia albertii]
MNKYNYIMLIISSALIVCSLLMTALNGPGMIANYLAVGAIGILLFEKLLGDKRVFYLSFFFIYGLFGQIISLVVIEKGWYLIELGGIKTYTSYALIYLCITSFIFINLTYYLIKISIYRIIEQDFFLNIKANKFLYMLPVAYLVLIYVPVFYYGPALTVTGGNRILYRDVIHPFFAYLMQIRALIFPLAGLYLFNKNKHYAYLYIMLAIVWNFLIGEKASGIIVTAYFIFLPYVLINYSRISNIKLLSVLVIGVLAIIFSIVANYVFIEGNQAAFILDRISMQGQLWWYYFNEIVSQNTPTHAFMDEFIADETGLIGLMKFSMPTYLYDSYMSAGYILTSGFPAIFVFYFGMWWLFPTMLCSLAYIFPVYFLTKSLYKGEILSFLISNRIFASLITLTAEGSVGTFLDYKLFIYIIILLFLQYMPRVKI